VNTMLMAMALMFPAVHGQTAYERNVNLPDELNGKANVVIVMFKQDQQSVADTWLPVVQNLARENSEMRYKELKVFSLKERLDGDHRAFRVTDPELSENAVCAKARPWTIKRALHLPSSSSIYTLLVDKTGTVKWRAAGALTPMRATELREAVAQLVGQ
jgi:hypothetical protein